MTSLKDLAKKLDLSITQVSRALDDKPDVAAATKAKVRAAAEALNYQPNAAARSLRKRKADTIAVVLPAGASHIGLAALLEHAVRHGGGTGGTRLRPGDDPRPRPGNEIDVLKRIVEGRRADAIIVVRTCRDDPRVAFLAERGMPFVTHGRTGGTVPHAFVDGDGEAGFAEATRLLPALGHTRIAHLAARSSSTSPMCGAAGWLNAMREAGSTPNGLEVEAAPNEHAGEAAVAAMLRGSRTTDGAAVRDRRDGDRRRWRRRASGPRSRPRHFDHRPRQSCRPGS